VADEKSYTIMLVEDDPKIAAILCDELERNGYTVGAARDYRRVKEEFLALLPDLVLLDINLPHYDGFYWCRQIRTVSRAPIIFISARSEEIDQVRALESGGDDYIPKPFNLELALARVRSALRRAYGEYATTPDPETLRAGSLALNKGRNLVRYAGQEAELTPKEFRLLLCLAERLGQIVTREALLEALWDDMDFVDDNTLTVNVTRVRRRLADLGLVDAIETKRGQGYRLSVDES
jgi:two-component system, OmpR family, response regulator